MDILIINPGNASGIYQGLSSNLSAIEPPTRSLLLAEALRKKDFEVGILDVNAERLSIDRAESRVIALNPKVICFVVYGQNVNAGTVSMSGAVLLANALKTTLPKIPIGCIGSYVQALPFKALKDEKSFDFVFTNEGVYALINLLKQNKFDDESLGNINGIGYRKNNNEIRLTKPEKIVPSEKMDEDLPGYAWDLLPFREYPLDLYRAPLWHADYQEKYRSPYAAIQTSLGCNYGCSFCMINILNRDDNEEIGVASNYKGMRFWSTNHILRQFDILNSMGVSTIRIVDEMFLLYKKHYVPLCEELSKRHYSSQLRMWSYSRIDTVTDPEFLKKVRSAGIRWLCLGIESAAKSVRLEVSKGKFEDVDIARVISQVHGADIEVMANYIVGLPGETRETMEKTLKLSLDLNTSGWNMYTALALPGSELYKNAVEKGTKLPESYTGFSWHSKDTLPLPTADLSPGEILKFRDEAFTKYHTSSSFLNRIEQKFGNSAKKSVLDMTEIKLERNNY